MRWCVYTEKKTDRAQSYTTEQLKNVVEDIKSQRITVHCASKTYLIRLYKNMSRVPETANPKAIEQELASGIRTMCSQ